MTILRTVRALMLTIASGALAVTAVLWAGVTPAGASLHSAGCVLLILCPPPPKAPTTTAAPATTVPATTPTTAKSTPTTVKSTPTTATKHTTAAASATRASSGQPAIGSGGAVAPAVLPALGTGSDPVAPQLANASAPTSTVVTVPLPVLPDPALSGLVGTTRGLPNDHSKLRIALSLLTLLIAAVALAQLPASRRSPPQGGEAPQ